MGNVCIVSDDRIVRESAAKTYATGISAVRID